MSEKQKKIIVPKVKHGKIDENPNIDLNAIDNKICKSKGIKKNIIKSVNSKKMNTRTIKNKSKLQKLKATKILYDINNDYSFKTDCHHEVNFNENLSSSQTSNSILSLRQEPLVTKSEADFNTFQINVEKSLNRDNIFTFHQNIYQEESTSSTQCFCLKEKFVNNEHAYSNSISINQEFYLNTIINNDNSNLVTEMHDANSKILKNEEHTNSYSLLKSDSKLDNIFSNSITYSKKLIDTPELNQQNESIQQKPSFPDKILLKKEDFNKFQEVVYDFKKNDSLSFSNSNSDSKSNSLKNNSRLKEIMPINNSMIYSNLKTKNNSSTLITLPKTKPIKLPSNSNKIHNLRKTNNLSININEKPRKDIAGKQQSINFPINKYDTIKNSKNSKLDRYARAAATRKKNTELKKSFDLFIESVLDDFSLLCENDIQYLTSLANSAFQIQSDLKYPENEMTIDLLKELVLENSDDSNTSNNFSEVLYLPVNLEGCKKEFKNSIEKTLTIISKYDYELANIQKKSKFKSDYIERCYNNNVADLKEEMINDIHLKIANVKKEYQMINEKMSLLNKKDKR